MTKMGIAMQESGVKPEVEVFDAGMIYDAAHYLKKGVLKAPLHFQFCMGCAGGIGATMDELLFMKKSWTRLCLVQHGVHSVLEKVRWK